MDLSLSDDLFGFVFYGDALESLFPDHGSYSQCPINLLPFMSILDSSNSVANKDMISNTWTNRDTTI